jgi:hypothetical protein
VPPARVSIYVDPQIRDGFVDVDRGVLDSIKDLEAELARPHGIGERLEPDDVILQLSPQFHLTGRIAELLKPRVLSRQIRRFA